MSTIGVRLPLKAPAFQFGLPLGSFTIGGRKKKSGFPLWDPSETMKEGDDGARPLGFRMSLPLQPTRASSARHNDVRRSMAVTPSGGDARAGKAARVGQGEHGRGGRK